MAGESSDLSIGYRARRILGAVVSEYLATGDAVASRTVTRRHGIDLSPATVRNVMSDLEELGLLRQPHQSAGRVPTDRGLRVFVDTLLKVRSLGPKEREEIRARFGQPEDFDAAMRDASRVLTELSKHAAVVILPGADRSVCDHLEFVRLRDGELLAVLVTREGRVENKLVHVDFPVSAADLERIHNVVDSLIAGRTLEEARTRLIEEMKKERAQADALLAQALALAAQAMPQGATSGAVLVGGQANLLESVSGADLENVKGLFRALEEKEIVARLLERTLEGDGIHVFIGAENAAAELESCSVVATSYGSEKDGDRALGVLAVIGPTRMNYSKIIPVVDFTARLVGDVLARR